MTITEFRSAEEQSDSYRYGFALGAQDGVRAERARARAILSSAAAEGRRAVAVKLATETQLDAEVAIGILEATPKAAAAAADARPGEAFYRQIAANAQPHPTTKSLAAGTDEWLRARSQHSTPPAPVQPAAPTTAPTTTAASLVDGTLAWLKGRQSGEGC